MTLAEFLASMEAQYGRSGTTEDVLNIPIDQAQGADVSIQVSSGSSPSGLSYMLTTDLTSGQ